MCAPAPARPAVSLVARPPSREEAAGVAPESRRVFEEEGGGRRAEERGGGNGGADYLLGAYDELGHEGKPCSSGSLFPDPRAGPSRTGPTPPGTGPPSRSLCTRARRP